MSEPQTPDQPVTTDPDDDAGQKLAPQPTPVATAPEPSPGGPDAVPGVGGDGPTSTTPRDLPTELNPATEGDLPDGATGTEDTSTAATRGEDDVPPEDESPA